MRNQVLCMSIMNELSLLGKLAKKDYEDDGCGA